ncbi:hypothetical protein PUN28_000355 [Cardiocondyla obscurior]|uniref:Uncharacterized protein n=1 Tax=Cardiocondyla obscurior TaxID=286306 RepID=A0AAW2GZI8_9HYME
MGERCWFVQRIRSDVSAFTRYSVCKAQRDCSLRGNDIFPFVECCAKPSCPRNIPKET